MTHHLTKREREVARLTALALTAREIAERLEVSVKTTETHWANIKIKLGLPSSRHLLRWAVQHEKELQCKE